MSDGNHGWRSLRAAAWAVASEATAQAAAEVDCKQTGTGPRKRKRKKLPRRPPRMTWCEDCGRAGLRWKETDPLDEVCRYCVEGEVKVRRYPTLTEARAALEDYFKRSSMTHFR